MSESFEQRKLRMVEKLKVIFEARRQGSSAKFKPSEDAKVRAVIGYECTRMPDETDDEAQAALYPATPDDYEKDVIWAIEKRIERRIGLDTEHPTAKVFRHGIASIRAGVPSEMFLQLLELIADTADSSNDDGRESRDVLSVLPGFGTITAKSIRTAKRDKRVADDFRTCLQEGTAKGKTFSEIKCHPIDGFMAQQAEIGNHQKTVENALAKYDFDIPAKKPGRRRK